MRPEHVFLSKKEHAQILRTCHDIVDDHNLAITAFKFRTKAEYDSEVIRLAYNTVSRGKHDES